MPVKMNAAIIIMMILLLALIQTGCREVPEPEKPQIEVSLERVVDFYRQERTELDSWWELVALFGAGVGFENGPWQLPSWSSGDLPPGSDATSYAGFILGLLALGENPWDWQERHLPAELASLQQGDGSFGGSINQTIWAMLALDVTGFSYSRQEALAYLRHLQQADGGFALTGGAGDPDVTAMALLALSFNRGNSEAEAAVGEALAFLEGAMLPSGGYASYNEENANSAAIVLSGLVSAGEDVEGMPWQKDDSGPLRALWAYQLEDGSFSFFKDPLKHDVMATYQALLALGDVVAGTSAFTRLKEVGEPFRQAKNELQPADPPEAHPVPGIVEKGTEVALTTPYANAEILYTLDGSDPLTEGLEYEGPITLEADTILRAVVLALGMDESAVSSFEYVMEEEKQVEKPPPQKEAKPPSGGTETRTPPEPTINVTLRVVGESKTYYNGQVKVLSDKANALQALLSTGLEVKLLFNNSYVSAIQGEAENLATGAGWKFKVNGAIPSSSALQHTIKENDTVIWWYADTPDSTGP